MSSLFRKISFSLGPWVKDFTIQLPDFSRESVSKLEKLSSLDWTEHHIWSVEDLELFQHLGIVVSVKLRERHSPDIFIDEIIEDEPAESQVKVQRILPKSKSNAKLKKVKTSNLLKPASVKNNNGRKRKGNSVNVKVIKNYDGFKCSVTVKKCRVMLKKEKFADNDSTCNVSVSSLENLSEIEKTDVTMRRQAELIGKNLLEDPVMLVENPLYDGMENVENTKTDIIESEDHVIEEILDIIKTNDIKKNTNIFKEEIKDNDEKEADREPDEEESDHDQIQKAIILEQDFSDDEDSKQEDCLSYTALHNTRDTILKELGLSDDEN